MVYFSFGIAYLSAKRLVGIECEEVVFRSVFIGLRSRPSSDKRIFIFLVATAYNHGRYECDNQKLKEFKCSHFYEFLNL